MTNWISVADKLPEVGTDVWVTDGARVKLGCQYTEQRWGVRGSGLMDVITHWAELVEPDPPEKP